MRSTMEMCKEAAYSIVEYVADNGRRVETTLSALGVAVPVVCQVNPKNMRGRATLRAVEGAAAHRHRLDRAGVLPGCQPERPDAPGEAAPIGRHPVESAALGAITVMIAVSKPEENDSMCLLARTMLDGGEA